MALPVLVAIGAAAAVAVYAYVSNLRRNILKARKTGLVYLVLRKCQRPTLWARFPDTNERHLAWSPINLLWQLTFRIWVPLIKLLPKAVWENRLL